MHLHLDLISGLAGDMTVAALLDLGTPLEVVQSALASLQLDGYRIEVRQVDAGMATTACKFDVILDAPPQDHGHSHGHSHHDSASGHGDSAPSLGALLGNAVRCLLYTSPSPRDRTRSRMPSSA